MLRQGVDISGFCCRLDRPGLDRSRPSARGWGWAAESTGCVWPAGRGPGGSSGTAGVRRRGGVRDGLRSRALTGSVPPGFSCCVQDCGASEQKSEPGRRRRAVVLRVGIEAHPPGSARAPGYLSPPPRTGPGPAGGGGGTSPVSAGLSSDRLHRLPKEARRSPLGGNQWNRAPED